MIYHKTTTKFLEEEAQLSFHEVKLYMINKIDNSHRGHRLTHPHLISISLKEQEDNLQSHNQKNKKKKERERFSSSFASCFSFFWKGYSLQECQKGKSFMSCMQCNKNSFPPLSDSPLQWTHWTVFSEKILEKNSKDFSNFQPYQELWMDHRIP